MGLAKRISAVFIALSFIFISSHLSYGEVNSRELTIDDKAAVLKKLDILRGDGLSYNLEGKLKRSEAAAFVVRLLCAEEEVMNNKAKYSITSFNDVYALEWYAPYIGYCVNNDIIDGYPDNTFKPDNYLSEQAFLKMVLTALGYKYNVDFSWNNVFYSAYNVGIVDDRNYMTKKQDNLKYTRAEVIEILFTTLSLQNINDKICLIQGFIDNDTIDKTYAMKYNLVKDEVETEVIELETVNSSTLEVTFNELIEEFYYGNVLLYQKDDKSKLIAIKDIEQEDDTEVYTITLSKDQEPGIEYTLFIANVMDSFGNKSDSFTLDFMSYGVPEVDSDFFRITKVEAESNNIVNVYFTQPINENALQAPFYTLKKDKKTLVTGNNSNLIISKLPTCNNGVAVYFKDYTFDEKAYYDLRIEGSLVSAYGVSLNDGDYDTREFQSTTKINEPMQILDCKTISENMIEITFSKKVNPIVAQQIYSYYVTDDDGKPIKINQAEVVDSGNEAGQQVRIMLEDSIRENEKYHIMINHVNDVTRQFSIVEKSYTIIGNNKKSKDVTIVDVDSYDATTLIVTIDRPLDQNAAEEIENYEIEGYSSSSYSAEPVAIYYNKEINPYELKVYLSKWDALHDDDKYYFKILNTMLDENGREQTKSHSEKFRHNESESMDTYISEAVIIGKDTIKLSFNKEISLAVPNVLNTNYYIRYYDNGNEFKKIPIGANYIDPTTIILKFDQLDTDMEYTVTFNKLLNYGNDETDNTRNQYEEKVKQGKQ